MTFTTLSLRRCVDVFASVGDNEFTEHLIKEHSKYCGAALYLPPPTATGSPEALIEYRAKLVSYAQGLPNPFHPYVILPISPYGIMGVTKNMATIEKGRLGGVIAAAINLREWSTDYLLGRMTEEEKEKGAPKNISQLHFMLDQLQKFQVPILINAEFGLSDDEAGIQQIYSWEINGAYVIRLLNQTYPSLKIIVLNVTTEAMVKTILDIDGQVYGAITPFHMLMTIDDVFLGTYRGSHSMPLPVPKLATDRELLRIVIDPKEPDQRKFLFSSGSSSHGHSEECSAWCTGMFTLPYALPILSSAFEQFELIADIDPFLSKTAQRVMPNLRKGGGDVVMKKNVVSSEQAWKIPQTVQQCGGMRPAFAGLACNWFIE